MSKANGKVVKFPDLPNTHCCICGVEIVVMCFKNTGVCCENHRKLRDNDLVPFRGGALAP